MKRIFILGCLLQLMMVSVFAAPTMRVLALFKDKAMIEIDGKRRLLVKGKRSPEGVKLLSSSGLRALVEVGGRQITLEPKSRIGSNYAVRKSREVRIVRGADSHFRINGTINGKAVTFLVDTGATNIGMGEAEARRLNIPFELKGTPSRTITASGIVPSYSVMLDSVSVGEIRQRNVRAGVIKGNNSREILLGMSFLNNLELQQSGNIMLLKDTR